jgi:hypothetical protein
MNLICPAKVAVGASFNCTLNITRSLSALNLTIGFSDSWPYVSQITLPQVYANGSYTNRTSLSQMVPLASKFFYDPGTFYVTVTTDYTQISAVNVSILAVSGLVSVDLL